VLSKSRRESIHLQKHRKLVEPESNLAAYEPRILPRNF